MIHLNEHLVNKANNSHGDYNEYRKYNKHHKHNNYKLELHKRQLIKFYPVIENKKLIEIQKSITSYFINHINNITGENCNSINKSTISLINQDFQNTIFTKPIISFSHIPHFLFIFKGEIEVLVDKVKLNEIIKYNHADHIDSGFSNFSNLSNKSKEDFQCKISDDEEIIENNLTRLLSVKEKELFEKARILQKSLTSDSSKYLLDKIKSMNKSNKRDSLKMFEKAFYCRSSGNNFIVFNFLWKVCSNESEIYSMMFGNNVDGVGNSDSSKNRKNGKHECEEVVDDNKEFNCEVNDEFNENNAEDNGDDVDVNDMNNINNNLSKNNDSMLNNSSHLNTNTDIILNSRLVEFENNNDNINDNNKEDDDDTKQIKNQLKAILKKPNNNNISNNNNNNNSEIFNIAKNKLTINTKQIDNAVFHLQNKSFLKRKVYNLIYTKIFSYNLREVLTKYSVMIFSITDRINNETENFKISNKHSKSRYHNKLVEVSEFIKLFTDTSKNNIELSNKYSDIGSNTTSLNNDKSYNDVDKTLSCFSGFYKYFNNIYLKITNHGEIVKSFNKEFIFKLFYYKLISYLILLSSVTTNSIIFFERYIEKYLDQMIVNLTYNDKNIRKSNKSNVKDKRSKESKIVGNKSRKKGTSNNNVVYNNKNNNNDDGYNFNSNMNVNLLNKAQIIEILNNSIIYDNNDKQTSKNCFNLNPDSISYNDNGVPGVMGRDKYELNKSTNKQSTKSRFYIDIQSYLNKEKDSNSKDINNNKNNNDSLSTNEDKIKDNKDNDRIKYNFTTNEIPSVPQKQNSKSENYLHKFTHKSTLKIINEIKENIHESSINQNNIYQNNYNVSAKPDINEDQFILEKCFETLPNKINSNSNILTINRNDNSNKNHNINSNIFNTNNNDKDIFPYNASNKYSIVNLLNNKSILFGIFKNSIYNTNCVSKFNLTTNYNNNRDEVKHLLKKKLNKINMLKEKLKQRKINNEILVKNSIKYKTDYKFIYSKILCMRCFKQSRNTITNCGHLIFCHNCVTHAKICFVCGVTIDSFTKLFRS